MEPEKSLLDFPCSFPLKAMGLTSPEFEALVLAVVRHHVAEEHVESVERRESSGGKYLSVTVTFIAHSQAQLDALYTELHADKRVVMTL